jgi:hypothetical protein
LKRKGSFDFETERTPVRLGKSDRYFYMDFNDTNFPSRLKQGREDISKYLEEKRKELGIEDINQLQAKEHTIEEIEKTINISNEIDSFIKNRMNYIFGYDVSRDVFGDTSSVSVTRKGEYYFDNFLNSVLPLVEREYQVRIQATNERIKKYVDKKGMHPALKK